MSSLTKVKLSPDQSADEAIAALLSNKVQAAPVLDENKLVGIVTSYDFLQREAFEGAVVPVDPSQGSDNVESYAAAARKICGKRVADVMTVNPQTVALLSNKVQAAPVLDENKLVGIVTSYDFLQREAFEGAVVPVDPSQGSDNVESYAAAARKICGKRVADVMTVNPQTVKKDAGMRDVAAKMAGDRLHTIPVVDDDGAFLGMITSDDVMRDVLNVVRELPQGGDDILPNMRP